MDYILHSTKKNIQWKVYILWKLYIFYEMFWIFHSQEARKLRSLSTIKMKCFYDFSLRSYFDLNNQTLTIVNQKWGKQNVYFRGFVIIVSCFALMANSLVINGLLKVKKNNALSLPRKLFLLSSVTSIVTSILMQYLALAGLDKRNEGPMNAHTNP